MIFNLITDTLLYTFCYAVIYFFVKMDDNNLKKAKKVI